MSLTEKEKLFDAKVGREISANWNDVMDEEEIPAMIDIEPVIEQLRSECYEKGYADCKAQQAATIERLTGLVRELADDVTIYVDTDYPKETRYQYPALMAKFDRDMEVVKRAEQALKEAGQ